MASSGGRDGGIGQAGIRRQVTTGSKMTIVDVDPHVLEFARKLMENDEVRTSGGCVQAFVGDLADPVTCERVVATHMSEFGRLDFLLNIAGGSDPAIPINASKTLSKHVDLLIAKNFHTMINLTNAALPYLLQPTGRRKKVINFCTANGMPGWGWAREAALAASKGAVRGYTIAAAGEFRGAIDFMMISPASVINPHSPTWNLRLLDSMCVKILKSIYLEFITAEQIAFLMAFLLDSRSPSFAGHDFLVDTGVSVIGLRKVRDDGKWWLDIEDENGKVLSLQIPQEILPEQFQPIQQTEDTAIEVGAYREWLRQD